MATCWVSYWLYCEGDGSQRIAQIPDLILLLSSNVKLLFLCSTFWPCSIEPRIFYFWHYSCFLNDILIAANKSSTKWMPFFYCYRILWGRAMQSWLFLCFLFVFVFLTWKILCYGESIFSARKIFFFKPKRYTNLDTNGETCFTQRFLLVFHQLL